jgi:hypothetical protein
MSYNIATCLVTSRTQIVKNTNKQAGETHFLRGAGFEGFLGVVLGGAGAAIIRLTASSNLTPCSLKSIGLGISKINPSQSNEQYGFILAKTFFTVSVTENPKSHMANISVATYTISVSKKFSRTPEPLDNFSGADLFDFLLKFLKDRNSPLNDKEAKFIISANEPKVDDRQISGIVETGDYGYSSELYDTEKKQLAYHRKPADADLKPFFYLFDLPKGQTHGLVVLQRFKIFGIRGLLAGDFSKYFEKHYPNSSVHIEPIVHPKIWQQFADGGSATKIRLRKFNIPQDICDMMKHGIKSDDGYVEYSIIAKKGKTFNVLKKMFGGDSKELLTLKAPDFKPDKTLVEVTLNGRKRTLDIADVTKLRTYFDVTEDVKIAKNGHPEFDSILEISKGILVDIWPLIKGRANV